MTRKLLLAIVAAVTVLPYIANASVIGNVTMTYASGATFTGTVTFADDFIFHHWSRRHVDRLPIRYAGLCRRFSDRRHLLDLGSRWQLLLHHQYVQQLSGGWNGFQ